MREKAAIEGSHLVGMFIGAALPVLLALTPQWANESPSQLGAISQQDIGSRSVFAKMVRDLDELLRSEQVVGGASSVDVAGAFVAHIASGTFIRAGLLRSELCLAVFPGCEEIRGVFLTTSELTDSDNGQTVWPGIYLVRKRPDHAGHVFFELLNQNGEVAYSREFSNAGIPLGLFRDLMLQKRHGIVQICISFLPWGACWDAVGDSSLP